MRVTIKVQPLILLELVVAILVVIGVIKRKLGSKGSSNYFGKRDSKKVKKEFSDYVIVTGGEPLMWNMYPLTRELKRLIKKFTLRHLEPIP